MIFCNKNYTLSNYVTSYVAMETSFLIVTQILHGNPIPRVMDDHEDFVLTTLIYDSYCLMMLTSQVHNHSQADLSNFYHFIIPQTRWLTDSSDCMVSTFNLPLLQPFRNISSLPLLCPMFVENESRDRCLVKNCSLLAKSGR